MRRLLVFITVALSALAVPATSTAQRAVHLRDAVDISASFESPLLSGACGFLVTVTLSGALDETLIYNRAGLVVRQIENTPAATATFSSPYGSFSFPESATSHYTYPGGATLGSTANFTTSGLLRLPWLMTTVDSVKSTIGMPSGVNPTTTAFATMSMPALDTPNPGTRPNRSSPEDVKFAVEPNVAPPG